MDTATWHEILPEQCPPSDAFEPRGFVCYRLCKGSEPADADFVSQRQLQPTKVFNAPECVARAVSVHSDIADSLKLTGLPAHRGKTIVELALDPSHGVVKKTGRLSHYSWWRSSACTPVLFAKKVGANDEIS